MFGRLRAALGLPMASRAAVGSSIHTATDYGRDILVNSPDGWEQDRQWLWWVGEGAEGGYGNPPPDARGLSGATAIPAVMRCTSIIADTIAAMPWRVYSGYTQKATPRWVSDPQMSRPDGRTGTRLPRNGASKSAVEFWAEWITSALWFGDGFIWLPAGRDETTREPKPPFVILHPDTVEWREGHWYVGESQLDAEELIHLRGEPPYPAVGKGEGIVQRFGLDLGLAGAMRNYASGIFNTGVPAGYLKVNAPNVSEPQADTLKARWLKQHGGAKRSIAVLNAATDFVPIALSPVDSQLDTAREWSLRDIALAFGVPAYMLGVPGDSSTYANVESRMIELRTFTLLPWIRRIESCLDSQFAAGTELKIITDSMLRADTATRFAAYKTALDGGWLTVGEIRALEDRPPLEQVSTAPEDTMPATPPPAIEPEPAELPTTVEGV
jgi:HK97 family phage portal protein